MREEILRVLTEQGLGEVDGSIHSWRCNYPDSYGEGPCTCLNDLVDALVKATS